jgi:alpha-ketoglutarate-dependent taurine dioxygenase
MAEEGAGDAERAALKAFARAVEQEPKVTLRLAPGDILGIDNGRMLHGRSP